MYLELYDKEHLHELYSEFGATAESIKRDVQCLKQWLGKQPYLPSVTGKGYRLTRKNPIPFQNTIHTSAVYIVLIS